MKSPRGSSGLFHPGHPRDLRCKLLRAVVLQIHEVQHLQLLVLQHPAGCCSKKTPGLPVGGAPIWRFQQSSTNNTNNGGSNHQQSSLGLNNHQKWCFQLVSTIEWVPIESAKYSIYMVPHRVTSDPLIQMGFSGAPKMVI